MTALDGTRADLALAITYLNKAEARDKICRAIQYGSKFVSNGEPGAAQNVDKTTSLARKVFRLFKVWLYLISEYFAFLSLTENLLWLMYLVLIVISFFTLVIAKSFYLG